MNAHQRLAAVLAHARTRAFRWGENDCALFAARCVQVVTGENFAAPFLGCYSTRRGALRALHTLGYEGLEDLCTAKLGPPLPSPLLAQYGDVLLVDGGLPLPQLSICVGEYATAPLRSGGLGYVRMTHWLKAWRVVWAT